MKNINELSIFAIIITIFQVMKSNLRKIIGVAIIILTTCPLMVNAAIFTVEIEGTVAANGAGVAGENISVSFEYDPVDFADQSASGYNSLVPIDVVTNGSISGAIAVEPVTGVVINESGSLDTFNFWSQATIGGLQVIQWRDDTGSAFSSPLPTAFTDMNELFHTGVSSGQLQLLSSPGIAQIQFGLSDGSRLFIISDSVSVKSSPTYIVEIEGTVAANGAGVAGENISVSFEYDPADFTDQSASGYNSLVPIDVVTNGSISGPIAVEPVTGVVINESASLDTFNFWSQATIGGLQVIQWRDDTGAAFNSPLPTAFTDMNELFHTGVSSGQLQLLATPPIAQIQFGLSDSSRLFIISDSVGVNLIVPSTNGAPTADAGEDQAARVGYSVNFDGSSSFDDNTPTELLTYNWSFISVPTESTVSIVGASTGTPSFVIDKAGTYEIGLIVTDEAGLYSELDSVIVSSANLAPTANSGTDQLVIVDSTVYLAGTGSNDPENNPLSYSWSIYSAPLTSVATLFGNTSEFSTLTPDVEGVYVLSLTVSDAIGPGTPDSVNITATIPEEFAEIQVVEAAEVTTTLDISQVTTSGNKQAVTNFLTQVTVAIDEGDIEEAITKLEKAIIRVDGCTLRGVADEKGKDRDWITDCTAQIDVYNSLIGALDALTQ
jgi:hypothetical protein